MISAPKQIYTYCITGKTIIKGILIFFLTICTSGAFAQFKVNGRIANIKGNTMSDLNIIISSINNPQSIIAYTMTDQSGNYSIEFKSNQDSVVLHITGFNIAPISKKIKSENSTHSFTITEKSTELREVVIKADKLYARGDTVNYNVASFATERDFSIGEVLKKMPGITVKSSGQIEYNGLPIKKFYIEGMDLMGGRYGIATNNLSPKDIASVQVFENHQDIEAMKELTYEDRASINLRLKQGVKGVFNLIGTVGIGTDKKLLWENGLIGTYFKRTKQHFITYKGNNTGTDLSKELKSFGNSDVDRTAQMASIQLSQPPEIDKSKYFFNNSNSATVNNIFRRKNLDIISVNVAYLNDQEKRESVAKTSYMLPDGTLNVIDEALHSNVSTNQIMGDFSYVRNEKKIYIKELFLFSGIWNSGNSNINTGEAIWSKMDLRTLKVGNKLHLIKKFSGTKGIEFNSIVNVEEKPHDLYVYPYLFDNLFPPGYYEGMHQHLETRNVSTNNYFNLLSAIVIGNLRINPGGFINYNYDELISTLFTLPKNEQNNNKFLNNTYFERFDAGINLSMNYDLRKIKFRMELPIQDRNYHLKQTEQDKDISKNRFLFAPNINVHFSLTSSSNLSASYGVMYDTPTISTLYNGYILSSYRSLSAYETNLNEIPMQFGKVKFDYRDVVTMLFLGASVSYNHYSPKVLYGNKFDGILSKVITQNVDTYGETFSCNMRMSKGFFWKSLKFGFEGSWLRGNNPLLIQDEVIRFNNERISLNGDFSLRLFPFLGLSYDGKYEKSNSRREGSDKLSPIRTMTNNASAEIDFSQSIGLSANIHNYYNDKAIGNKSFTLMDFGLVYTFKQVRLSLDCTNIFNVKNYIYSYMSGLVSYYSEYKIRPMSVQLKVRFKIH